MPQKLLFLKHFLILTTVWIKQSSAENCREMGGRERSTQSHGHNYTKTHHSVHIMTCAKNPPSGVISHFKGGHTGLKKNEDYGIYLHFYHFSIIIVKKKMWFEKKKFFSSAILFFGRPSWIFRSIFYGTVYRKTIWPRDLKFGTEHLHILL